MVGGHLRRLLRAYANYNNSYRTHLRIDKDTPLGWPVHDRGANMSLSKLGGLHCPYAGFSFFGRDSL
jgi:hypothetical protein